MAPVNPASRMDGHLDRSLPSSEESERVVLGAILLDNGVMHLCIEKLRPEMFYSPIYRRVFSAMVVLYQSSKNIDPILISEVLKRDGPIEAIGGTSTITNITLGLPYFTNVDNYIKVVTDKHVEREMIRLCHRTANEILGQDHEGIREIIDHHESQVHDLQTEDEASALVPVSRLAGPSVQQATEMAKSGNVSLLGVPSGYKDLDEMTAGYQAGDLIITAGRPSMGKTAMCLGKAFRSTDWNPDYVIAVFSLEMKRKKLIDRAICMEAKVDMKRYRIGHIMSTEWPAITAAAEKIQGRRIFIDDSPRLSVMEIKARCRRLRAEEKRLDLVIIDHGGLIKPSRRGERRHELGEITKDLKALAKDLNVPVNLLFQLSRGPEKRPDHTPIMADLRESGEIEEDADVIELLYRPEYYKATIENKGLAQVIIGKNRDGPTGVIKLSWIAEHTRFENYYGD